MRRRVKRNKPGGAKAETGLPRFGVVCAIYAVVFLAIGVLHGSFPAPAQAPAKQPLDPSMGAEYVGSNGCAQCHPAEYAEWRSSQHAAAMQEASSETVLGRFDGATFEKNGIASTFFTKDGIFWVRTDGPDGRLEEFQVRYTFGIAPLQQYLIELPGGKIQALGISWDARPKSEGGQRWFDLYPSQDFKAGHPLHWTGIDQNWNYQCAYCHSTNLKKNYDAATGHFSTTRSEISVGCEACHGPASHHVAWESKTGDWTSLEAANGAFITKFDERKSVAWPMSERGSAVRSVPRKTAKEIEACALCHSRRQQFASPAETSVHPLYDSFHPSLLGQGLYHSDGQQLAEVYNYGSFLQSRMNAAGVTCADCHNPHSGQLRLSGDAICGQCHSADVFDTPAHHHHAGGSRGAQCASCHMPTTTYMVIDPRHDHSIRIPRPDISSLLGTPNACNSCHADKAASWARDAIKAWFPNPKPGLQDFAKAFDLADRGAPGAQAELLRVIEETTQPPIVRASAVERLGRFLSQTTLKAVAAALKDPNPSVRLAAVGALADISPQLRCELLAPLLADSAVAVRIDVARALAGEAEPYLSPGDRQAFERALEDYIAAQTFNSERPEQQTNLADLYVARGQYAKAQAAARTAIAIDPTFAPGFITLSEAHKAARDEMEAEAVLRDGLQKNSDSAEILHALGLSLVRQKRMPEAVEMLTEAARLASDLPRFAFVAAVALHDSGKPDDALAVMRKSLDRNPYDRDLLQTLASYEAEAGQIASALDRAKLLRELEPDNRQIRDLAKRLESDRR